MPTPVFSGCQGAQWAALNSPTRLISAFSLRRVASSIRLQKCYYFENFELWPSMADLSSASSSSRNPSSHSISLERLNQQTAQSSTAIQLECSGCESSQLDASVSRPPGRRESSRIGVEPMMRSCKSKGNRAFSSFKVRFTLHVLLMTTYV